MSFGKDRQHLNAIPVYGGSTQQRAASAGKKRKRNYGNRKAYWMDTFRPSERHPTSVRLVPGEYEVKKVDDSDQLIVEKLPWFEFVEHYSGRHQRGAICSGGPWFFRKERRDPCLGCDQRDAETRDNRTMSRSDKFTFVAIDLGLFHQVPQVDRQSGQVKLNPKTSEPYLEWVKCAGRGCQNCQMATQSRYGHIQPWTMPKAHFNSLNAYAAGIGSNCVTCRGRNTIQAQSWHCGNPQCQALFFDMNTTSFTDEQIAEVVNGVATCQSCQQATYPKEVITCLNCSPHGWQPMRATIFDVDLQVQIPRTGDNNSTVLQVIGMSDPKPIDPVYQDLLQYAPDLSKRFAPSSLETQAELWKINPNAAGAGQPGQSPGQYGQPGHGLPPAVHTVPYGQAPVQTTTPPMMPQHPVPQGGYPPPQQNQPAYSGYPNHTNTQQPATQYPNYAPQPAPQPPQPPTTPPGGYSPPHGGYNPGGGYNQ